MRQFFDAEGSTLSDEPEFVHYYAFPYVSNPASHPSFKALFQVKSIPTLAYLNPMNTAFYYILLGELVPAVALRCVWLHSESEGPLRGERPGQDRAGPLRSRRPGSLPRLDPQPHAAQHPKVGHLLLSYLTHDVTFSEISTAACSRTIRSWGLNTRSCSASPLSSPPGWRTWPWSSPDTASHL